MSEILCAEDEYDSLCDDDLETNTAEADNSAPRKRVRNMTESQRIERRERNREHAKRSRVRKKVLVDTLQDRVKLLVEENERLRDVIRNNLPQDCDRLLAEIGSSQDGSFDEVCNLIVGGMDQTISDTIRAPEQAFLLTDPSLPDNPIVYVSDGFALLTGYDRSQLLGRNCRLLQGPASDPMAVRLMREGVKSETPITVCLVNYKADMTPFYSQVALSPVRDETGRLMHFMGVQHEVTKEFAENFMSLLLQSYKSESK